MDKLFLDHRLQNMGGVNGQRWTLLFLNLSVAGVYFVTGLAGLKLAFVSNAVTLFWPPSGLAFAAIWMGGTRLTPGVILGALLVNLFALRAPPFAALVAVGNALPAVVGSMVLEGMLKRQVDLGQTPGEFWRVQRFILVAALGASLLSATIGTLAVTALSGSAANIQSTWMVWWLGDAMGVLIVAPPILLWERFVRVEISWRLALEALVFASACLGVIAGLLLIRNPIWAVELCKLFTLLISLWAGTRFGLNGPAAVTLLMAGGGVAATTLGVGPFARSSFYDSFALLHSYLFAEAIAGMLLAAALADLRRTVAAETRARGEAEAASANRVRLLMAISHDVRTPLAGMIGVLQTLDRNPMPDLQAEMVALGLRAGRTLTRLVTDILDVARGDAGRIVLEPGPFDPGLSIRDVVAIHADPAASKGLRLNVTGLAALPARVVGDQARFEQVLGNLLGNAVNYTAAGGVSLWVEWREGTKRPLVFEVADTGPGIDIRRAPDVFNAFVLEPNNRSAGLGLGLHICRNLVALMDGEIQYRPRDGGGSIFRVELPLPSAAIPSEDGNSAASATRPPEPPRRVLLVEDDLINQTVTRALLESDGHTVRAVGDAEAAVAAAATGDFDLILMDIHLWDDDQSGVSAARRIRALNGQAGTVPIIALTADASADRHALYAAAGIDGVFVKPFGLSGGLADAVRTARLRTENAHEPSETRGPPPATMP